MINGDRKKPTAKVAIVPNQLNSTFRAMCRTRNSKPVLLFTNIDTRYKHLDFTGFDRLKQSPDHVAMVSAIPLQLLVQHGSYCRGSMTYHQERQRVRQNTNILQAYMRWLRPENNCSQGRLAGT